MNLKNLKKGLFGYQKASVYEYIASEEEEFAQKLMEQETQAKEKEQQYQEKIHQLESKLEKLKYQYNDLQDKQTIISSSDEKTDDHTAFSRQEAEAKIQKKYKEWEDKLSQKQKELDLYYAQVMNIRKTFCNLLRSMDTQTNALEQQIQTVMDHCPSHNMTLFERKKTSKGRKENGGK